MKIVDYLKELHALKWSSSVTASVYLRTTVVNTCLGFICGFIAGLLSVLMGILGVPNLAIMVLAVVMMLPIFWLFWLNIKVLVCRIHSFNYRAIYLVLYMVLVSPIAVSIITSHPASSAPIKLLGAAMVILGALLFYYMAFVDAKSKSPTAYKKANILKAPRSLVEKIFTALCVFGYVINVFVSLYKIVAPGA